MLYGQIKLSYYTWQDDKARERAKNYKLVYKGSGGDSHLFKGKKDDEYYEQHTLEENDPPRRISPSNEKLKDYIKKYYNI